MLEWLDSSTEIARELFTKTFQNYEINHYVYVYVLS
jgi:hypothetical protein